MAKILSKLFFIPKICYTDIELKEICEVFHISLDDLLGIGEEKKTCRLKF